MFFAGNGNCNCRRYRPRRLDRRLATPDLGRITGGGGIVDRRRVDLCADDTTALPKTSSSWTPSTYQVVDTIEPLDVNGVALLDGSLWVTHQTFNVVQKFDLGE